MAFPYLMYLGSVGTCSPPQVGGDTLTNTTNVALGIANIYFSSGMKLYNITEIHITTSYYSICLSLNVILTLMIVIRLMVHIRNVRKATRSSDGSSGLHTVVMMLIESYALYAGVLLVYTIPLAVDSWVADIFPGVICIVQVRDVFTIRDGVLELTSNYGCTQVIAPYLIILRVAKRRAMTSESISGIAESIRFRSQVSTDGGGSIPNGGPTNVTEVDVEAPGEPGAGNVCAIEEVP